MATTKKTTPKKTKKAGALKDVVSAITSAPEKETNKGPLSVLEGNKVLVRPLITEKSANLSANNVYTFLVSKQATKIDIVRTVKQLFKVTPRKVAIMNVRGKKVPFRTRRGYGMTNTSRKAYIYLKKGDSIDFAA